MFKIGAFSKITGISVHQLRHYNRIGLLNPAYTDEQSCYRYYTVEQLPRLNRLLALKDLGFSLEQIKDLLHEDLSADEIRGMLRLKRAQLEQTITDEQARLKRVENRLLQIDEEGILPDYNIVLKEIPPQTYVGITLSPWDDMQVRDQFEDLYDCLMARRINHFTQAIVILDDWYVDSINFGFLIEGNVSDIFPLPSGHELQARTLPRVELAATIIHDFPRSECNISYGRLVKWIGANNYTYMHPHREIYLRSAYHTTDVGNMAEFQIPIRAIS